MVTEDFKPIAQRLDESLEWLDSYKLNHRFSREDYDGLQRIYWLLRALRSEREGPAPK